MGGKVVRDKEPQTKREECDPCGFDLLSSRAKHTINHSLRTNILMTKHCFYTDERCTATTAVTQGVQRRNGSLFNYGPMWSGNTEKYTSKIYW